MVRYPYKAFKTSNIMLLILFSILPCHALLNSNIGISSAGNYGAFEFDSKSVYEIGLALGSDWNLLAIDKANYFATNGFLNFTPSSQSFPDSDSSRENAGINSLSGYLSLESKAFLKNSFCLGINANLYFDNKNTVDFPFAAYHGDAGYSTEGYFTAISNSYLEMGFLGIDSEDTTSNGFFVNSQRIFAFNIGLGAWYYSRWLSSGIDSSYTCQATSGVFHIAFESNLQYTLGMTGNIKGFYDKVLGDGQRFYLGMSELTEINDQISLSAQVTYDSGKWNEDDLNIEWQKIELSSQLNYAFSYGVLVFAGGCYDIDRGYTINGGIRYSPSEKFNEFHLLNTEMMDHLYYRK